MKRFVLFLVVMLVGATLFAQVQLPEHQFAAGQWGFIGTRLYQNDVRAPLAKMNLRAPQSGPMIYEFNVRYEDGLQDGHGGFGLHVFADSAFNGASWGAGKSYLLWLNYDLAPVTRGFPAGFTAQVYKSLTNSRMDLVESFDLNWTLDYISWDDLNYPVPVKIWINGDTGEVRVYDPTDPALSYYWFFNIDRRDLPLSGNWVALRTNGVKLSFGLGL
jgi:hypothetical protein